SVADTPVAPDVTHESSGSTAQLATERNDPSPAATSESPPLPPVSTANTPAHDSPRPDASHPLDLDAVIKVWPDLVKKVGTALGWKLAQVEPLHLEGSDVLVIAARPGYNSTFDECGTPEAQTKIAQALQRLIHRPVKIKYVRRDPVNQGQTDSRPNEADRANSLSRDPLVQRVLELFEARPVQMDYGEAAVSPED